MNLFGLQITRTKSAVAPMGLADFGFSRSGGWWPLIREPFTGAWQRNQECSADTALAFAAVYACVTLIAQDIAKLRVYLVQKNRDGIWEEIENPAYSPVLRKPNHYQNRIRFYEQWISSKLIHGNTYVLKERDQRGVVSALYVLDPSRVRVLVTPDGEVYYQLSADNLSGTTQSTLVPADEIIHDMTVPLFHPLCGVSPITACGLAALQGLRVQRNSERFFGNDSKPGGILTAPGVIDAEMANTLSQQWEQNYGGDNYGRVAVLGGGLDYKPMAVTPHDAQLIEQLKWTAENVCTAFHVPPFKIGVAPPPANATVEALNLQYYQQCLQNPIESIELCLDEGLDTGNTLGTEFDIDDLLRMDTPSLVRAGAEAIGSGGVAPNEARKRWFNLGPVNGGESPYLQQQNYSLEALAKRDAQADPFAKTAPAAGALPAPPAQPDQAKHLTAMLFKELALTA